MSQHKPNKPLYLIMFSSMLALLVLSVVYYKERIGYHDTATYLISIIRDNNFNVHHSRFVSMASQWLPLVLMKIGASFKVMAIGYSIANVLIPIILALICLFLFKNPFKAVAILLYWVIMNSMLFYYVCSEVQAGLAILIFYDGFIDYLKPKKYTVIPFIIISLLALPTVVFSHPINILVVSAWVVYRFANKSYLSSLETIIIAIISIGSYIIKKLFFVSTYELSKTPPTSGLLHKLSPDIYIGHLAQSFYQYLLKDGFLVPLLFVLTIGILIHQKKKLTAGVLFLIVAGFYTLILLAFQTAEMYYDHYTEHLLQPIVLFIVLAFTDNLSATFRNKIVVNSLFAFLFIISFCKIANGHTIITQRHEWYKREFAIMDKCGIRKAIISRDELPAGSDKGMFWNAGDETLFLSALDGSEHSKTIFYCWPWFLETSIIVGDENRVLLDGSSYPINVYNPKYFHLENERYTLIRNDSCIKN